MEQQKNLKSMISNYNLYNLKLMACLSDANSKLGVWNWYDTGLHLNKTNSESRICLVDFPEYKSFLKNLTGKQFKTISIKKKPFGFEKNIVSYSVNEIQNAFESAIKDKDVKTSMLNKVKQFTEKSAKEYVKLLVRTEKYAPLLIPEKRAVTIIEPMFLSFRTEKYAPLHAEYQEDISKSTVLKKFLGDYSYLFCKANNRYQPSVAKLIGKVNTDFKTNLNYYKSEMSKMSFNTLCLRLNKRIQAKVKYAATRCPLSR